MMIAATKILKPGPARIAKIMPGVTLPRTVPIPTLIITAASAILGLLVTVAIPFTRTITSVTLGMVAFGALGVVVATYSPLKGESMVRWFGLEYSARRDRVVLHGKPARVYVGICPVHRVATGKMRIRAGAVDVPAGAVDERGLPRKGRAHSSPLQARTERPSTSPQSVPFFVGSNLNGWAAEASVTAKAAPASSWDAAAMSQQISSAHLGGAR